ncbi:MAG: hypothetical protein M1836_007257 [Candelina mexicana]|nr:MAG: hypothetical protein M1836_007257 [Candelina mexicana]
MSPEKKRKASESIHSDDEVPACSATEIHSQPLLSTSPTSQHIELSKITIEWDIIYPRPHDDDETEDDNINDSSEFEVPWSTRIWGIARNEDRVEVGQMYGRLIQRCNIRRTFSENMTITSQDATTLALEVFDRHGRLKDDLKNHKHKKGSGVWREEVDLGSFLIVEEISVQQQWRRQGIGSKLGNEIWHKAQALMPDVSFAFASQTQLVTEEVDERRQDMAKSEIKADIDLTERISIAFLRRQGYRRIGNTTWLALAADAEHPSHDLAPSDDHDWLKLEEESEEDPEDSHEQDQYGRQLLGELDFSDKVGKLKKLEGSEEELLLHYAMTILNDEEGAAALINTSATIPVSDSQWDTTDGRGNTVLHLAASHSNPASVAWILHSTLGARLIGKANRNGETPLEALQTRLELRRVKYQAFRGAKLHWVSDQFRGFDDDSVSCLLRLQNMQNAADEDRARVRFGCTCGLCIQGIMSPRMRFSLFYQAERIHQKLDSTKVEWLHNSGDYARRLLRSYGKHIHENIHLSMILNTTARAGFINLFSHVATCLLSNVIPSEAAVLNIINLTWEAPPVTRRFLDRGGDVASAIEPVFEAAMDRDEVIGHGKLQALVLEEFSYKLGLLKRCRNDHEYGFVRAYCAGGSERR